MVDQRCVRLLDPGQLTVTGPNAGTVRYGIGRKAECVQRIAAGCRAFVQWPQTDGLDGGAQTFHFLAQPFTVAIGFDAGLAVGVILQRDFLLIRRQIERQRQAAPQIRDKNGRRGATLESVACASGRGHWRPPIVIAPPLLSVLGGWFTRVRDFLQGLFWQQ